MNTEKCQPTHRECREMLDKIVSATDALHYLNTLLDLAVNSSPEMLADQRSGLSQLMGRQLEDIGEMVAPLRAYVKQCEREAAAPRNGLTEGWITPPIYRPGIEDELRAKAAASATAEKLRGADLEAIARDTNLAEATVRRVVERLLAEPDSNPDRTASNG